MAKFQYRMQNILTIKEKLESQEKIAFSLANAELLEEQQKLQNLLIRKAGYEKELKEQSVGTLDIHQIQVTRHAIDLMKVAIRDQMMEVHRAELRVNQARKRLNEVMQDRKMHEKLKEKQFEEFVQEQNYEEAKIVDGLVSYNYGVKEEE